MQLILIKFLFSSNLCKIGAEGVGALTGLFSSFSIPWIAGFTANGIAGGSIAAAIQAYFGNVAAGSAFSFLQSLGATTILGTAAAPVFAVVGAGGAVSYYVFC